MTTSVKTFNVSLDFKNSIDYCLRPDDYIKNALERIYIGKNYQDVYLLRLVEVIQRGPAIIRKDVHDTFSVDVIFTADTIEYKVGQVLHDVLVDVIAGTNTLAGTTKTCKVTFMTDRNIIIKGFKYPVKIIKCTHEVLRGFVSIVGSLYMPSLIDNIPVKHTGDEIDNEIIAGIINMRKLLTGLSGEQAELAAGYDSLYTLSDKKLKPPGTEIIVSETFSPGTDYFSIDCTSSFMTGTLVKSTTGSHRANMNTILWDLYTRMEFIYNMAVNVPKDELPKYRSMMVLAKKARQLDNQ